jgi:hypothetical protein
MNSALNPEISMHDANLETIDWDNPQEKRNPQNWPVWKKLFHTAVPCILAFVM